MNLQPRSVTLHSLRASLALAFVVMLAGLGSLTPAGAETIAWNVAPADESGPDGRVSLRHEVEPGESVQDAIAVTNTGDVAATFTISAGDGVVGADGAFDIDDQSHDGAGGWLTVSGTNDGTLTLEPDQFVVLPVTIDIPETALPGDHPAGIAVGVTQGADVQVSYRFGVRLHLRVAGEIEPGLRVDEVTTSFSPSWIPFAPGELNVEYRLTNDGNVRLGAAGTASASAPFGLLSTEAEAGDVTELLPGESVARTATISAPSLFWLSGELRVTPLRVGTDALDLPGTQVAEVSQVTVSWTGLALAVVIGAVIAGLIIRRRARR